MLNCSELAPYSSPPRMAAALLLVALGLFVVDEWLSLEASFAVILVLFFLTRRHWRSSRKSETPSTPIGAPPPRVPLRVFPRGAVRVDIFAACSSILDVLVAAEKAKALTEVDAVSAFAKIARQIRGGEQMKFHEHAGWKALLAVLREGDSDARIVSRGSNICSTLWTLAALKISDAEINQRIVRWAQSTIAGMKPGQISVAIWGFAKLGITDKTAWDLFAAHLDPEKLRAMNASELSNVAWGFSGSHMVLSHVAWGVSGSHMVNAAVFQMLGDAIVDSIDTFPSRACAMVISAYAKVGISHPGLFQAVATRLMQGHAHYVDTVYLSCRFAELHRHQQLGSALPAVHRFVMANFGKFCNANTDKLGFVTAVFTLGLFGIKEKTHWAHLLGCLHSRTYANFNSDLLDKLMLGYDLGGYLDVRSFRQLAGAMLTKKPGVYHGDAVVLENFLRKAQQLGVPDLEQALSTHLAQFEPTTGVAVV